MGPGGRLKGAPTSLRSQGGEHVTRGHALRHRHRRGLRHLQVDAASVAAQSALDGLCVLRTWSERPPEARETVLSY